ncbi:hypothetical protein FH609_000295 [Streptomyces sp. 3MP-14]|uniref:Uncharacterized protein n=1 Tax=Streptomyces mimosae TaxID=2586635 RepID=A0A5N6ASQ7_9ACTN|nr:MULTISPECIES: hypothetical protein [Streptomyces]KAB8171143.1 hypothetical protein FH607_002175 [Streptomyces mimosae]KAB8179505.1 hypothetical protein FH609_000295 [Streptomyces sp. 3MP-14]
MTDSLSGDLWAGEREAPADKARAAAHTVRDRADEQARAQSHRAADRVRQVADELSQLARQAPDDSPTRALVARAADGGHRAAGYLDRRGLNGLLDDASRMASQRPAAFVGATALAGFAMGRLAKAGRAAGQDQAQDGDRRGNRDRRGDRDRAWSDASDPVERSARHGTFDEAAHPERTGYPEA